MRPANEKLFGWIQAFGPIAKYNLASSGLSEPNLPAMRIDTSFESFASEKDEHTKRFADELAELYHVAPENIVVTAGASEAIFLVYSVLGAGRKAVIPLPNYGPMFSVPKALGLEVLHTLSNPPAGRTIFGLTDPNNPTGQSVDTKIIQSLTTPAHTKDTIIFINETYREFTFPRAPATHFAVARNVVVCSTMTKFYGLGRLRVGWILADEGQARILSYGKWAMSNHDSEYSLWIATQVLRKRRRFVERARSIVQRNAKLVHKFIANTKGVSAEVGAAPFCLVRYERGPGSVALARALLRETGVLVCPGDFFGAPMAFRLCFTSEERVLSTGLDELSGYLNGLA